MSKRYFPVYRDLEGNGVRELVDRAADELTDAEILALDPEAQAYVCAELNVGIEDGEVYAMDAADAVVEAA